MFDTELGWRSSRWSVKYCSRIRHCVGIGCRAGECLCRSRSREQLVIRFGRRGRMLDCNDTLGVSDEYIARVAEEDTPWFCLSVTGLFVTRTVDLWSPIMSTECSGTNGDAGERSPAARHDGEEEGCKIESL